MEPLFAVKKTIERIEAGAETPEKKLDFVPVLPIERQVRTRNFNLMAKGKIAKVEGILQGMGCGVIPHHKERKLTIFCLEPNACLIANRPLQVTSSRDKLVLEQFGTGYRAEFNKGAYIGGRWSSALVWLRHYVDTLLVNPQIVAQQMEGEKLEPPPALQVDEGEQNGDSPVAMDEFEQGIQAEENDVADPPAEVVVVKEEEAMEEDGGGEDGDSTAANAGSDDEDENIEKRVSRLEEEKNWILLGMADLKAEVADLRAELSNLKSHGF